jgi:hypothetical protein
MFVFPSEKQTGGATREARVRLRWNDRDARENENIGTQKEKGKAHEKEHNA